ncbi:hypothetical protein WMY93_002346 [Mugilogobius chulae]|uniref:Laminin G domain-containing protein n=1 Tax=Mugilogobius chulae TaxID=88201 RepID=A0AAW0Q1T8_9GOBI
MKRERKRGKREECERKRRGRERRTAACPCCSSSETRPPDEITRELGPDNAPGYAFGPDANTGQLARAHLPNPFHRNFALMFHLKPTTGPARSRVLRHRRGAEPRVRRSQAVGGPGQQPGESSFLSPQTNAGAFDRMTIRFLVTSLIKALLPRLLGLDRRTAICDTRQSCLRSTDITFDLMLGVFALTCSSSVGPSRQFILFFSFSFSSSCSSLSPSGDPVLLFLLQVILFFSFSFSSSRSSLSPSVNLVLLFLLQVILFFSFSFSSSRSSLSPSADPVLLYFLQLILFFSFFLQLILFFSFFLQLILFFSFFLQLILFFSFFLQVILFYSEPGAAQTVEAARFPVSSLQNQWTRFAVAVDEDKVKFYLNCDPEPQVTRIERSPDLLELEPGAGVFVGQAGGADGDKHVAARTSMRLRIVGDPRAAERQCEEEEDDSDMFIEHSLAHVLKE